MGTADEVEARQRQAFVAALDRLGVKPIELARTSKVPATTIYSYIHGKTHKFGSPTQKKLAGALGTTVEALFDIDNEQQVTGLAVTGVLGALGDVSVLEEALYEIPVPPPLDLGGHYRAFEVGDLFMPPAEPGWIVIFHENAISTGEALGRACLCELADGRLFFRRLKRSPKGAPYFCLDTWNGAPAIEDVKLIQALPFVAMVPSADDLARRHPSRRR